MVTTSAPVWARYPHDAPLVWELEHAGGTVEREPDRGVSILESRPAASMIFLVDSRTGHRIVGLPLKEDGRTYQPVFFRKRAQDVFMDPTTGDVTGASPQFWEAHVLGRVREKSRGPAASGKGVDVAFDGLLLAAIGGRVVDCPARFTDMDFVALCCNR